jgi:putative PIN family toxin of toxin-antitoxin system
MTAYGNVVLLRSPELTAELTDILQRPKFKKHLTFEPLQYVRLYENLSELHTSIPVFGDCIDPKDNYLFDLAYQANAQYLVSGNHHVLKTPVNNSLKVVSLSEFKALNEVL